jgi:hypothetical protein
MQPPQSKLNLYVAIKEYIIVLSVVINYKHLHVTYFMQEVITSAHTVDNGYLIIWRCFTKVKGHKNL